MLSLASRRVICRAFVTEILRPVDSLEWQSHVIFWPKKNVLKSRLPLCMLRLGLGSVMNTAYRISYLALIAYNYREGRPALQRVLNCSGTVCLDDRCARSSMGIRSTSSIASAGRRESNRFMLRDKLSNRTRAQNPTPRHVAHKQAELDRICTTVR